MSNAKKHSANKSTQPTVKPKVTEFSNELEFSNDNSLATNNRLAKNLEKLSNPEMSHYISQCSGKSMGMMEILKLKNMLNYRDLRSVISWCAKNDVFIIQQGNKQFVNQWEFILSFYKPFIKHLKKKHKNWKEMFLGYVKGSLGNLLEDLKEEIQPDTVSKPYKAKNKSEASFLNKIKKI